MKTVVIALKTIMEFIVQVEYKTKKKQVAEKGALAIANSIVN